MPQGFEMDSGIFTEDFTGEIADVVFTPGEFGTQAVVTVALDEPITKRDGTLMNDKVIYLRTGDGWGTADGVSLTHDDPTKKITARSQWGAFANRVVELSPDARDAILTAGGGVYSTLGWKGLRFHFMTEGAGEKYSFTDRTTGEVKSGERKGVIMPVEYLGTSAAPLAGQVGATAPVGFSVAILPDTVIEAWTPLAESTEDNGAFMKAVMGSGLYTKDKLGDAYGPVTKALGDGELRVALGGPF